MDRRGAARHDGGEKAFGCGDAANDGFRYMDMDGFLTNDASAVAVVEMMASAGRRTVVRATRVAVVIVVVVYALLLLITVRFASYSTCSSGRVLPLLESASERILVNVVKQTSADSRVVVAVVGKLLGNISSVEPRLGVLAGRVVVVGVVAGRRYGALAAMAASG